MNINGDRVENSKLEMHFDVPNNNQINQDEEEENKDPVPAKEPNNKAEESKQHTASNGKLLWIVLMVDL